MAQHEPKNPNSGTTKGSSVPNHPTHPESDVDGYENPKFSRPPRHAHTPTAAYMVKDTEPAEQTVPPVEYEDTPVEYEDTARYSPPSGITRSPKKVTPTNRNSLPRMAYHGAPPPEATGAKALHGSPSDSVRHWPPDIETQGNLPAAHPEYHLGSPHPTPPSGEATIMAHLEARKQAEASQSESPYLVVMSGNLAGQIFTINPERTLMGRSPDCEVSLFDVDISRIHAEIRQNSHGSLVLKDFDSTNGTYVNGKQVSQSELRDGDRVQLGCSTILKFAYQSAIEEMYQRRLYENAVLDGLTQIYNRKFFDERLTTEFSFAQRHSSPLSLLMIDIDHFKQVNDNYGHPTGDEVLRSVAQNINTLLRKEDMMARYGGEEFAILTRNIQPTQAAILGERIRSTIEHLDIPTATGLHLRVTASIGVVTMYRETFTDAQDFVQEGDNRLYRAKHQGRNQVVAESE